MLISYTCIAKEALTKEIHNTQEEKGNRTCSKSKYSMPKSLSGAGFPICIKFLSRKFINV